MLLDAKTMIQYLNQKGLKFEVRFLNDCKGIGAKAKEHNLVEISFFYPTLYNVFPNNKVIVDVKIALFTQGKQSTCSSSFHFSI